MAFPRIRCIFIRDVLKLPVYCSAGINALRLKKQKALAEPYFPAYVIDEKIIALGIGVVAQNGQVVLQPVFKNERLGKKRKIRLGKTLKTFYKMRFIGV